MQSTYEQSFRTKKEEILSFLLNEKNLIVKECLLQLNIKDKTIDKDINLFMLGFKKRYQKHLFLQQEKEGLLSTKLKNTDTEEEYFKKLETEVNLIEKLKCIYKQTLSQHEIERIKKKLNILDKKLDSKGFFNTKDVRSEADLFSSYQDKCFFEIKQKFSSSKPVDDLLKTIEKISQNYSESIEIYKEKKNLEHLIENQNEKIEMLKNFLLEKYNKDKQPLNMYTSSDNQILISYCRNIISYLENKKSILDKNFHIKKNMKKSKFAVLYLKEIEKSEYENWKNLFKIHNIELLAWSDPKCSTLYKHSLHLEAILYSMLRFGDC